MIPKKIHYCWFGKGKKDPLLIKCINSWGEYLPDYEIIEWNEDNFDINSNKYVKQAYEKKVYAFVSDYVRLHALHTQGGIYLDTDMEVIKNMDELLELDGFIGFENRTCIGNAIIGSEANNDVIKWMMSYFDNRNFIVNGKNDLRPYPIVITQLFNKKYRVTLNGRNQNLSNTKFTIFAPDYFFPKSNKTNKLTITKNTYAIHHYNSSWFKFLNK